MVFQSSPGNVLAPTLQLAPAPSTAPVYLQLLKNEPCVYQTQVPNAASLSPVALGAAYVSKTIEVDSNSPQLYADQASFDKYNFLNQQLTGVSRFLKTRSVSLPDKLYEEFNSTEVSTKMGLFPEINRAWVIVDNKLNLWNYDEPAAASITSIDDIPYTILAVAVVTPKPRVFVADISHLLVVSTPIDIYIFLVKYSATTNAVEVFNAEMAVPAQGLAINRIVQHAATRDIYMAGEGDGCNVWRLEYSNKEDWFNSKCSKTCLTRLGFTGMVLPGGGMLKKIPGLHYLTADPQEIVATTSSETIIQMEIDQSRGILYTLSSLSIIRAYRLVDGKLGAKQTISPRAIINDLSTTIGNLHQIETLRANAFKLVGIHFVASQERGNLYLVAVTSFGLRIYINGSMFSTGLALKTARVKFPPSKTALHDDEKEYMRQLVHNQQHSTLLKNTKLTQMIAPGCFVAVKATKNYDKLFVSIPNYGFLKKTAEFLEDCEFLLDSGDLGSGCFINDVVVTQPFALESANVYASQYLHDSMEFAVLTNMGVNFFRYRTPDVVLQHALQAGPGPDHLQSFMELNGMEETCSSLLYLSCKIIGGGTGFESSTGRPTAAFRHQVQTLFATSGLNARMPVKALTATPFSRLPVPMASQAPQTVDQVILSDRFYGIVLLVSRLFREYWHQKVFVPLENIKLVLNGILKDSVKDDVVIKNLNTSLEQLEFFIGSILILLEFFERFGNSIPGLNAPQIVTDPFNAQSEVCIRAEHMALTALLKLLHSMKEALSFLMVLVEETRNNKPEHFKEILRFMSVQNQVNLLALTFRDFMAPAGDDVRNLIKDLLSAILNKNILKGGSIDLVATSLQEKCGSFCSSSDVVIFKAIEKLTKAKSIGDRDPELKVKNLTESVALFEQCSAALTLENIENATNIMLELDYHLGAVQFVLNAANKIDVGTDPKSLAKRSRLYRVIFHILTEVDGHVARAHDANDRARIAKYGALRESTYATAFAYPDEKFHAEFYDWFRDQGMADRFLDIDTDYILPYLEFRAKTDRELAELLWAYFAKRENHFEAAKILYSLAVSDFPIPLTSRIEYLSRANGFVNCVCPPHLRQQMVLLGGIVNELADVASIQLDALTTIESDDRISLSVKAAAIAALNRKVLSISEIFNAYVDPLGYYDLCLVIFKASDYKNTDDILKRWELLFEKVVADYRASPGASEPLHIILGSYFTSMGRKVADHELVFPIDELFKLLTKYVYGDGSGPAGCIVNMFVESGVGYDKLYYVLRDMVENSVECFPGYGQRLRDEMVYLIKQWVHGDKHLRGVVDVRGLEKYEIETDPIALYLGE
ncbi:hypothetical protein BABINDRAFT_162851 [Babjeviella inositovora NRRL Y-12698]|uniref:Nucleoporin Nup133/Nup155-like N-terminal domain-containing protein n=1 Tax=Babjeviella inositovora NRRL Y-12698 TaxID=984486 RepID=A0A1E3QKF5_9ASCO|nr:uncharacterized protein BABINDRAFT_162851 [Babjeviella inositovora NRRL Y-12698]ODQ78179.1 hypothetical protein BABINDRAFT_162851 [Babjeviella inositovora NRRL Y-12698]